MRMFLFGLDSISVLATASNRFNELLVGFTIDEHHHFCDGKERQWFLRAVNVKATISAVEGNEVLWQIVKEFAPADFMLVQRRWLGANLKAYGKATIFFDNGEISKQVNDFLCFSTTFFFFVALNFTFKFNAIVMRRSALESQIGFGFIPLNRAVVTPARVTNQLRLWFSVSADTGAVFGHAACWLDTATVSANLK